ncbi:MAG: putative membrane protein [Myxococcota bacterium]|jgi:uncharacterized membrane protein
MFVAVLMLGACGGDAAEDTAPSPDSASDSTSDPFCETAPVTTWNSFGHGFLIQNCQPCHGSAVTERYGAPESMSFDTEADAALLTDQILAAVTDEDPTMPPEGGITDDDRYYVKAWLQCYPPSS